MEILGSGGLAARCLPLRRRDVPDSWGCTLVRAYVGTRPSDSSCSSRTRPIGACFVPTTQASHCEIGARVHEFCTLPRNGWAGFGSVGDDEQGQLQVPGRAPST